MSNPSTPPEPGAVEQRFTCGCTFVTTTKGLHTPTRCPEHGGEPLGLCPYCHKPVAGKANSELAWAHSECVPSSAPEPGAVEQMIANPPAARPSKRSK